MIEAWANVAWLAGSVPDAVRFARGLRSPAAAQTAALRRILEANANCWFGQVHEFASIRSIDDFRKCVPPADYEDVAPAIARMVDGEQDVLTSAPVLLFEPSSGSTAPSKLIPYTAALKREFQAGLAAWVANTYWRRPALLGGPAYWSITPLTQGRRVTPGGVPIGFEVDSAYLGPMARWVDAAMAVPSSVKGLADMDAFRYATLRYLLATPGLRLFSVWNPTFLTLLLDALVDWWPRLVEDVAAGTLTLPGEVGGFEADLGAKLRPDPHRARDLDAADPTAPDAWRKIWPRLGLISCWADGPAAHYAAALGGRLAGVPIQPKGLLATEAMVSLPWYGAPGPVLAVTGHFLEFQAEGGEILLAHELAGGGVYTVLVTTGGGLYRYRLHDLVEVVGRVGGTPCVRFAGRADRVSDWFGEKLSEAFVSRCVENLICASGVGHRFALVAPRRDGLGVAYALYLEVANGCADGALLATRFDTLLRENFHYDYCRRLGQLQPAQVILVADGADTFHRAYQARGVRLGQIKPALLDGEAGWDAFFAPRRSEDAQTRPAP